MLKRKMPPNHPGLILWELCFEPLNITQTEAAQNLGITRKTLSMLINGKQGISADMAIRIAKAFNSSPEIWMRLQQTYDLWFAARKVDVSKIKTFKKMSTSKAQKVLTAKPKVEKTRQPNTRRVNKAA